MTHTLEIKSVSKAYPNGTQALNNVTLTLTNGMFGLLGPNGAGKSSLMRSIAGLQAIDSGSIQLLSEHINQATPIKNNLGYLPQEFGVLPGLSAYELLDHIALLKGVLNKKERREQIDNLLAHTNLYSQKNKSVSTFSGGMKQRFGIAQALLGSPKVLIVDEPTAGLDPQERNRFHNLLSELSSSMIVLLSTHIVEDVRELCSQMAIIDAGRIIIQGNPSQLLEELTDKIWTRIVDRQDIEHFKSNFNVISARLIEGRTHLHIYSETMPDADFERIAPDLEDVFFTHLLASSKGETNA